MKNVIYINCWIDPWAKVAKKLQEEYGYKPVWWIGYSKQDNSHITIPSEFPGIVYQDDSNAWKGRFPKEVEEKAPYYYLDVDFLKRHAHHELQAIKMMDRMDQDLRSFNFMERQRHFRNMLKSWMAAIDLVKPDLVISTAIPHRLYDYVLFWLCEEKGIPFLTFQNTSFPGRFYISKNEFYSINNLFIDDWKTYEQQNDIKRMIPFDIFAIYEKANKDYDEAIPDYMVKQFKAQKAAENTPLFFKILKKIQLYTTIYRPFLFGRPADTTIIGHSAYAKRANAKYENSDCNIYQREIINLKVTKYKKCLKRTYEELTTAPDYNEEYVVHFLHYQPEATTCPGGDIFVDQRLCIELLLKNLPINYKIYVKEHPSQFMKRMVGHTGRMRDLYDDLIRNERVKLISTSIDSFKLIKHAQAVSTITGTVGWESMVRRKPVIAFGLSWYENYSKGVLRISDENSAKKIFEFIDTYQFNEHSLLAYLASVGKHTQRAYFFKASRKENLNITEDDCINNMIKAIVGQLV